MTEVGVFSRLLTGSIVQVTPNQREITLEKVHFRFGLHRRPRGQDMKGKSCPVKAMDLFISGLEIPEMGVT